MSEHFDLAIIGTGSGNSILDERFEGWKVAIVERDRFGGTCLNHGCIPTKMLVVPADLALDAIDGPRLGVDSRLDGVRWRDVRDRVFGRIDPIVESGERYRRGQTHVTVLGGNGAFSGDKELTVDVGGRPRVITADRFVLAVGARPVVPDVPGLAEAGFHTSDTVMRIDTVPHRLAILGGGFIAAELADVFGSFGSRVDVITTGPSMLSHHDPLVSDTVTAAMAERFGLRLRSRLRGVTTDRDTKLLAVEGPDGTLRKVDADLILVAVGRRPNGDQLHLERTGVRLDADGFIHTDATLETSVPGIFALGDARTPLMLKHVANHEARVVQHNLLSPADPLRIDERAVPHAVFCHPQAAAVGLTEPEARAAGHDIRVGVREYAATTYGWALEDTTSACKVIVDAATGQLLGAHVVGNEASLLVQQLVQGMRFGLTAEQLAARGQMYIHPALSEVVEQALLAAIG